MRWKELNRGKAKRAALTGWRGRRRRAAMGGATALVVATFLMFGSALAFQPLGGGAQVNDDPASGIDNLLSVSGQDPANAAVVGGATTAGAVAVPWALFRQQESGGQHDQLFARSFSGGVWSTRGAGAVEGRSSGAPTFAGSLNFDQAEDAQAPSIDFAGAGRAVPWASWYETTSGAGFGAANVFASHFDNSGDANQGKWIFGGQGRGNGGGSVPVPSLNIHTDQNAENPSLAGGSTVDPTKPAPWVSWQETTTAPFAGKRQIFVARGSGAQLSCDGFEPSGVADGSGHVPAVGGFCWQQAGIPRVGPAAGDPSLNVDPSRDGLEPDIAFAGAGDATPWVVWYESGVSSIGALHGNAMVFAAKGVSDAVAANGGHHWVEQGSQGGGTLDTSGSGGYGKCSESAASEAQCSLNSDSNQDAESPRVAAGTMQSGAVTVPWVVWSETRGGVKQIFVARLVGAGAGAHFELANGGQPISTGARDSSSPDIAFSANTPYISWREDLGGGVEDGFNGHFVNAASPTFVLDESDVPLTPAAQAGVREPISSACVATPFNVDGSACQGGAIGTPFFLFTSGSSPLGLFADSYQPQAPSTGGASNVGSSSATVSGSLNPQGAAVSVYFQYGTSTAYGQSTQAQSSGVTSAASSFSASLTGFAPGTTIHYRIVAGSDFGTFFGGDRALTTTAAPTATTAPPSSPAGSQLGRGAATARTSGTHANVKLSCVGAPTVTCRIALALTVTETLVRHRLVGISASSKSSRRHKVVVVGSASATLKGGESLVVRVTLNRAGRRLLAVHRTLKVRVRASQADANGVFASLSKQLVTFRLPKRRR